MLPRLKILFWPVLFCAIVALNWNSLHGPYILDDDHTIYSNEYIKTTATLKKIWTSGKYYSALPATWGYRPITTASTILLWQMGDGATWPFHASKWFFFFAICIFTFLIWKRLLPEVSEKVLYGAILLFTLNPVHSQLMGYIAASSSLLSTLFILASVHFFLVFRENRTQLYMLALSAFSALAATLCKEEGVVVIALLILSETFLQWKTSRRIDTKKMLPLSLPVAFAVLGVYLIFAHFEPTQNLVRSGISPWEYFMTQWRAYLRYFAMFFWSYELNADNLNFGFSYKLSEPRVIVALVTNSLVLMGSVLVARRHPLFLFVALWFYASVSPHSSVIALGEPVNDHRALVAYVGLSLIPIVLLQRLHKFSALAFSIVVFLVGTAYGAKSFHRSFVWADKVALWEDTLEKNPLSARAHNNLATALMEVNELRRALDVVNRCVEVAEYYAYCHVNQAVLMAALGQEDGIEESFKKGLERDVHYVISRLYYAIYLSNRGFFRRARVLLEEADTFALGNNHQVRLELIKVLKMLGETERSAKLQREMDNALKK